MVFDRGSDIGTPFSTVGRPVKKRMSQGGRDT